MLRFAILGFGFMGSVHAQILKKLSNAKLVAIADPILKEKKKPTKGNISVEMDENLLDDVEILSTADSLFERNDIDCISICLPTYLHREYTIKALNAGKHVICEKPMALSTDDCDVMIQTAENNQKQLFVGQCIRFWPEYVVLKDYIKSGKLGKPVSLMFRRLAQLPTWTGPDSWFLNQNKSGGCHFDLHVHDVDFINFVLGKPNALFSQGLENNDHLSMGVMTQFHYDDSLLCFAEGNWTCSTDFKMMFTCIFENGQLDYDSSQKPTLILTKKGGDSPETVSLIGGDGYEREYKYIVDCLGNNKSPELLKVSSVRDSIALVEAEIKSWREKKVVQF